MNAFSSWQTALASSWNQVWVSFLGLLPSIFGAIIIFSIGLLLAFWVRRLIVEILKLVKLGEAAKLVGADKYLTKAGVKLSFVEVVGSVFEWVIILVFFLAAVDILGLNAVSKVLTNVLGYVPNIIAAALILAAGYFIAGLVEKLVRGALTSVNHEASKPVSNLARWVILVVVFFTAVEQLQIARGLVTTFFQGLTYTIVLAIGLSFGLGSKDLVSKILEDWYNKFRK